MTLLLSPDILVIFSYRHISLVSYSFSILSLFKYFNSYQITNSLSSLLIIKSNFHINYNKSFNINYSPLMITKTLNFRTLRFLPRMRFSGGHHQKVYDWRDDTSVNEGYEQDVRQLTLKDPHDYHFPHTAKAPEWVLAAPANYNQKDLTQNLLKSTRVVQITNNLSVPETDWIADAAHEKDYESEDLDFQPESFETQHFRKKGPIWMWIWVGIFPITFFSCEFFFQGWVDEDNYRYQRPPPLMYPDEDDTPDAEDFLVFQTKEYNEWWDAGVLKRPYMKIEDGKKIYFKHAGVNQPAQVPELD